MYSVITPAVVIRPILLPNCSVNHSALSGPLVMCCTSAFAVGTAYSVITPAVVMRPILLPATPTSPNQSAPSGPAVIPSGALFTGGSEYSLTTPAVVIRPILLAVPSTNQTAPSGPDVIPKLLSLFTLYRLVTTPPVVIRAIGLVLPDSQSAPSGPAVIIETLEMLLLLGYSVIVCARDTAKTNTSSTKSRNFLTGRCSAVRPLEICFLSRICGVILVLGVVPGCDKGQFPWPRRYESRRIVW